MATPGSKAPVSRTSAVPERQDGPKPRVSARCIVIGLLLVPVNVYWVIAAEVRW